MRNSPTKIGEFFYLSVSAILEINVEKNGTKKMDVS